jgi:hypothetical protein
LDAKETLLPWPPSLLEVELDRCEDDGEIAEESFTTITGTGDLRKQNRETLLPVTKDLRGDFPCVPTMSAEG